MERQKQIVRTVHPRLAPGQRLITGPLARVQADVMRGRRQGVFTCDWITEEDEFAWAIVTMRPAQRSHLVPVAAGASLVGLGLIALAWWFLTVYGAVLLVAACVAGSAALLAGAGRRPAVQVDVSVRVDQ